MADDLPIFTVGHSTRTIAEFVDLLRHGAVDVVIDVRTIPRSRRNPQYNEGSLGAALAEFQVTYERIADLGGLRSRSSDVPAATNAFWENQSFHNYADYALSNRFENALEELIELSSARRCAIMCAEAVWWRCHRRIIADYLLSRGRTVLHLMNSDRIDPARITPAARCAGGKLTYPVAA